MLVGAKKYRWALGALALAALLAVACEPDGGPSGHDGCGNDAECSYGQICQAAACVPAECRTATDCGAELDCLPLSHGRCVPTDGCRVANVPVEGTCPESCVAGTSSAAPRDTGYEYDDCATLGSDGTCDGNLLAWCGTPPDVGDGHMELRWNCCPAYADADGNPKVCGFNAAAGVPDCVPDGCQHIQFRPDECSGNICRRCDRARAGGRLYECDFTPSSAGRGAGGFTIREGC